LALIIVSAIAPFKETATALSCRGTVPVPLHDENKMAETMMKAKIFDGLR
jgi:hypothetical protein